MKSELLAIVIIIFSIMIYFAMEDKTRGMVIMCIGGAIGVFIFFCGCLDDKKEGFMTYEPIQDNTIPYSNESKNENKIKEYVPYTISPFLEVPFSGKNVKNNDPMTINQLTLDKQYPESDMNPFKNNKAYPEACNEGNAMFSTNQGCIKLTPEQIRFMSSRGHNMDPTGTAYI